MNQYLASILLGIVEGLTEFLPVSSTAHLRIAQALIGLSLEDEFWKLFAIVIQLGAILSVVFFFWRKLKHFTQSFLDSFPHEKKHPFTMMLIGFVTTAIPALLLTKLIGKNLESLTVMASALFVGGIVMFLVDYFFRKPRTLSLEEITPFQAFFVGAAQILSAVFPGTSRSMSTIAGGQLVGMSRAIALEFSFFLSIPVMFAATFYDLFKYWRVAKIAGSMALDGHQLLLIAIGFVVSFIVAYGVIAWFLAYVRKNGFLPFVIYRLVLGILVLAYMR